MTVDLKTHHQEKIVIAVSRIGGNSHLKLSFNFLEEEFCNCLMERYTGDIKFAIDNYTYSKQEFRNRKPSRFLEIFL